MLGHMKIVYTDGYEEKYHVTIPENFSEGNEQIYIKNMLEHDIIKLFVDKTQMILIPMCNIRKIIFQDPTAMRIASKEFPGFLHVSVEE